MKTLLIILSLFTVTQGFSKVCIDIEGKHRYVRATDKPNIRFRVPLNPQIAKSITPLEWGAFGVSLNGIPFDPSSTTFWDLDWHYTSSSDKINLEVDRIHSLIMPDSSYHYNETPRILTPGKKKMLLIGWAADGFPIYSEYGFSDPNDTNSPLKKMQPSYKLKPGARKNGPHTRHNGTFVQDYVYVEGFGDLDACNGRFGKTDEYPEGIYHYFLTDAFPFIPRYFKGKPDPSFLNCNRRK